MSLLSKLFGSGREIPAEHFDLWQRVEIALERVRPMLQADGGNIELIDVTPDVIKVKMKGACAHCASSTITLTEGVERVLREDIPEFKQLVVL